MHFSVPFHLWRRCIPYCKHLTCPLLHRPSSSCSAQEGDSCWKWSRSFFGQLRSRTQEQVGAHRAAAGPSWALLFLIPGEQGHVGTAAFLVLLHDKPAPELGGKPHTCFSHADGAYGKFTCDFSATSQSSWQQSCINVHAIASTCRVCRSTRATQHCNEMLPILTLSSHSFVLVLLFPCSSPFI